MEQLPIELECFLMTWGFFESERGPGYKPHAPVYIAPERTDPRESIGWMPSYPGEEPPF